MFNNYNLVDSKVDLRLYTGLTDKEYATSKVAGAPTNDSAV